MKMSQCFSLPLRVDNNSSNIILDRHGDLLAKTEDDANTESICRAINLHDEMVSALESMETIVLSVLSNEKDIYIDSRNLENLRELLIKAKGEAEC